MGSMTAVRMSTFVRPKPGGLDVQEKDEEGVASEDLNSALFDFFPVKGFHPNGGIFAHQDLTEAKQKELISRWEDQQATSGTGNVRQTYDDILDDFGDPNG